MTQYVFYVSPQLEFYHLLLFGLGSESSRRDLPIYRTFRTKAYDSFTIFLECE